MEGRSEAWLEFSSAWSDHAKECHYPTFIGISCNGGDKVVNEGFVV